MYGANTLRQNQIFVLHGVPIASICNKYVQLNILTLASVFYYKFMYFCTNNDKIRNVTLLDALDNDATLWLNIK